MRSNPQIDPAKPLPAYNGSDIRVPQLCGVASAQPPVSTIAASCSKWWPLANTSFAGTWTCGDIAGTHLGRNLQYLNTINNGVCPQANTVVPRGMRLCITPPSAVRTVAAIGHRRQLLMQQPQGAQESSSLTLMYPGLRRRLGRALLQTPGGTCILTSWVAVGQTCDDITTAYNIDLGVFLKYNPGLDCAVLDVGTEVCVAVAASGTARLDPAALTLAVAATLAFTAVAFTAPFITRAARAFSFALPITSYTRNVSRGVFLPTSLALPLTLAFSHALTFSLAVPAVDLSSSLALSSTFAFSISLASSFTLALSSSLAQPPSLALAFSLAVTCSVALSLLLNRAHALPITNHIALTITCWFRRQRVAPS
ncbi:hypothetical protein HXX76_009813 [Chlamydomonas incerta]|uniref:LysM domain-containing protein n=1 Tax=Chlamydomonas incerta TaxID=51695 RepID=A0A835SPK7_CHLIN|nr:hypothetical protein HXX76_009813 [Chlamydomonas incerta]|eukprot:KAG2430839.1 hypothetical protein HXX76_009813 [Chlamydomonas incerta]